MMSAPSESPDGEGEGEESITPVCDSATATQPPLVTISEQFMPLRNPHIQHLRDEYSFPAPTFLASPRLTHLGIAKQFSPRWSHIGQSFFGGSAASSPIGLYTATDLTTHPLDSPFTTFSPRPSTLLTPLFRRPDQSVFLYSPRETQATEITVGTTTLPLHEEVGN